MNKNSSNAAPTLAGLCAVTVALLAGCGGGGGGSSTPAPAPAPSTYLLGGTVTGLAPGGSLTLSNGSDVVAVSANGDFSFQRKLSSGESYTVASISSPGHICTVAGAAAAIAKADVTTVKAVCVPDVRLLAGAERVLLDPRAIVVDTEGNTLVFDAFDHVIRKIAPSGVLSTYAGVLRQSGTTDGPLGTAQFKIVNSMVFDREGNLIVAEGCGLIRKVTKNGTVSTIAGSPSSCSATPPKVSQDGEGQSAVIRSPSEIVLDVNGDYLVVESGAEGIRRVTPAGVVTTMRWTATPIPGSAEMLKSIYKFTVDKSGNIFASGAAGQRIWKIAAGVATAFAGGAKIVADQPVDGQGSAAGFLSIRAMTLDPAGNIYFSDFSSLRKLTADGTISTVAGYYNRAAFVNGPIDGSGSAASMGSITALAVAPSGNVILLDSDRGLLRSVTPAGVVSTPAGIPLAQQYLDGEGSGARFSSFSTPVVDPQGNLYVFDANVVRKITPTGTVSRYAGVLGVHGTNDGAIATATFDAPTGMTIDSAGSIYFIDGEKLRKISAGVVSTLFQNVDLRGAGGMAVSAEGTLAVVVGRSVRSYSQSGTLLNTVDEAKVVKVLASAQPSYYFFPITPVFDSGGNLYFGDQSSQVFLKLSKDYVLTKFSGKSRVDWSLAASVDGPPDTAVFAGVGSLTIDAKGNLYTIASGSLRMIAPSGVASTLTMPWGNPAVTGVAYGNGKLYAMSRYALVQMPVP